MRRTRLPVQMRLASRLVPSLLVLLAAAPVAFAATRTGRDRPAGCRSAGHTIDAGPGGRVYFRPTGDPDRVFFCSQRTGRRAALGWDDCSNAAEVQVVRVGRRFLALDLFSCGPGGTASAIDLRRTGDGRRVRRLAATPGPATAGALADVTDLVLRADGALAWIVELRDSPSSPPRYELRRALRGAAAELVAQGPDIAPGSLALAGSTLYWMQGGTPRSSPL